MATVASFQDDDVIKALRVAVGQDCMPRASGRPLQDHELANSLVALVDECHQAALHETQFHRIRCAFNDAFFADYQWAAWSETAGCINLDPPRKRGGRPRAQLNIFKPYVVTAIARFLSTRPRILVRPGSLDDEVVETARLTQKFLEHQWQAQQMDRVLADFVTGFYLHGDGALKVEWNPRLRRAGTQPVFVRDESGARVQAVGPGPDGAPTPLFGPDGITPVYQTEMDELGQPVMEEAWQGGIETTVHDSTCTFFEPGTVNPQDSNWWLLVSQQSPAWVLKRFGVQVMPEQRKGFQQDVVFQYRRGQSATSRTAEIKELWIKPGPCPTTEGQIDFPTGMVLVTGGGKLLSAGPNVYTHGEIPIVFERALIVPKQPRGDTPCNSLREVQVLVNKTASQWTFANDMCANPRYQYPADINIKEVDRSNVAGTYVPYTPQMHGGKIEIIPGVSVPAGVQNFLMMLRSDFGSDISWQKEGGLAGGAPAGIEAGIALEALIERDVTKLAIIAMAIGRVVERWAFLTAMTAQQFMPQEQVITVLGKWNETETVAFKGADIRNTFSFAVVPNSVMPQSRAAEYQKALLELDKQLIGPREFKTRTGTDSPDELSRFQIEAANARAENREARETGVVSTPPLVMSIEDHEVHSEEHQRALLDRTFQRQLPERWLALKQHDDQHRLMLQAMMQSMAMAQQAAPSPGEKKQAQPPAVPMTPDAGSGLTVPPPGLVA